MTDNIATVKEKLDVQERLCQLAEEASELSKAALKLRRAIDNTNPTPVSVADAYENLVEEVADVLLCLKVLGISADNPRIHEFYEAKAKRWVKRLKDNISTRGDAGAKST